MNAVCSSDRVTLMDTYQYDDSANDVFEREPYCAKFLLHCTGASALHDHRVGTPLRVLLRYLLHMQLLQRIVPVWTLILPEHDRFLLPSLCSQRIRRYLDFSVCDFEVHCTACLTHCTDGREIWRHCYRLISPRQIYPHQCRGVSIARFVRNFKYVSKLPFIKINARWYFFCKFSAPSSGETIRGIRKYFKGEKCYRPLLSPRHVWWAFTAPSGHVCVA